MKARASGLSESDILKSYPSLSAEELAEAWSFYRAHHEAIDRQVREGIPGRKRPLGGRGIVKSRDCST